MCLVTESSTWWFDSKVHLKLDNVAHHEVIEIGNHQFIFYFFIFFVERSIECIDDSSVLWFSPKIKLLCRWAASFRQQWTVCIAIKQTNKNNPPWQFVSLSLKKKHTKNLYDPDSLPSCKLVIILYTIQWSNWSLTITVTKSQMTVSLSFNRWRMNSTLQWCCSSILRKLLQVSGVII